MVEIKQHDVGGLLADAVLKQALDTGIASSDGNEKPKSNQKKMAISPRSGAVLPAGPGRTPGVKSKLTNLREAVLEAFDQVGGAQYLAKLAEGTSSDRAAFVGLVAKVLPTQINANVEGGISVQLSWLGARSIGTTVAQPVEQVTQVIDLERDNGGKYRIKDPVATSDGGQAAAGGQGQAAQKGPEGAADA